MTSIAYVTTTFPTLASFLEDEVHRLRRRGVRVRVFTLRPPSREYQPEHRPLLDVTEPLEPLGVSSWAALAAWLARRPGVLAPEALRILWASRGSAYALAGHLAYLPAAARLAARVEAEGLERVHGAWAHFPATVAYLAARLTGRRFSMAAHAGADLYRTRAFLARKVAAADFTAACVAGNAEMLRALAGPGARVERVYHGVDRARFDRRGRARDPVPLLLAVGRLAVPKGFDDAVRVVGELARAGIAARLILAGDGPERGPLERLAAALGVADRVEFAGAVTREEVIALYARAWVLLAPCRVMPNGRRDGIPNVVIEAMAMGVPCVGTRAAGLEEAIEPGETGALAAPGDVRALAEAVAALIGDPANLERLGDHARQRVARDFDAERSFERLLELFGADGAGLERRAAAGARG